MDKSGWVVSKVLAAQASRHGERQFLQQLDGRAVTYGEADLLTTRLANALDAEGVAHRESVAVMLPNTLDILLAWFALSRLGAVNVFINTAYKGVFLSHVLNNAGMRRILIHADFLPWLADIEGDVPALEKAYVLGESRWTRVNRVE